MRGIVLSHIIKLQAPGPVAPFHRPFGGAALQTHFRCPGRELQVTGVAQPSAVYVGTVMLSDLPTSDFPSWLIKVSLANTVPTWPCLSLIFLFCEMVTVMLWFVAGLDKTVYVQPNIWHNTHHFSKTHFFHILLSLKLTCILWSMAYSLVSVF